jgi:hypothetical protein
MSNRSPEYHDLNEIAKADFKKRWPQFLLSLIPGFVIIAGLQRLESQGLAATSGWFWLAGSLTALILVALYWRRENARMDEVNARIQREAASSAYNILLFLLVCMAILDAAFKFPNRIDGDSPWYLAAFASAIVYGFAHFRAWRRYFPTK